MLCGLPSCGKKATSDCASCKTRGYCSKKHQHDDWKAHKVECKRITKARKAGGGGHAAAAEGKDAGDVGGGEEPTPPRHITLRALMEEDGFDINTSPCGPDDISPIGFALGAGDDPIDEVAVKMVLDAPGLNIHLRSRLGRTVLAVQCSYGRSRNVELLLADGRIDPNLANEKEEGRRRCLLRRTTGRTSVSSFSWQTPGSIRISTTMMEIRR